MKVSKNNVNHPEHYKNGAYECIDVMLDVFGLEAVNHFCQLNAFKYLWRNEHKNGMEDIQKAIWYLKKIEELNEEGDMPTEGSKYNVVFGRINDEGEFEEIENLNEIADMFFKEVEETEEDAKDVSEKHERLLSIEKVAELMYERYIGFLGAGFEKNQAFALTRDWWQRELKGYSNHDNA